MKHLDLFSGIGGFALAARWAGIETVGFCEIDVKCRKVLDKHWPYIKKHTDIRSLDGSEYEGIDIITGGYPCQPFSVAGGQKANEDDRHLWPEMRRIIAQTKPTFAICENVYGHVALGLDSVQHDLEAIGFTTQPFIIPALATGANHNRDRVFIVAHSTGNGCNGSKACSCNEKTHGGPKKRKKKNRDNEGCGGLWAEMEWQGNKIGRRRTKPPPLRVDDELPGRMDRNRMLGNSIDPMIAYQLLQCIKKTPEI